MQRRTLALLALCLLAPLGHGQTIKMGIYLQGSRIGESLIKTGAADYEGRPATRTDSTTTMSAGMLGSALKIELRSTHWSDGSGTPLRMSFETSSAGRTQTVDAKFGDKFAEIAVRSGGAVQTKRVPLPTEGPVVSDALPLVIGAKPETKKVFFVLRPDTASFMRTEAIHRGSATTTLGGQSVTATLIEIVDPMTTLRVFVDEKGEMVKAEGPLGIEMIPEGKPEPAAGGGVPDLANASSIKPDKRIENPRFLRRLRIRLTGANLDAVASTDHQTTRRDGEAWVIDVHPAPVDLTPGLTIEEARGQAPEWVKPDLYMPADSEKFKALAREIIGNRRRVRDAALEVQRWVDGRMRANAGIGVLRDASEVLESKEGVCRDAAILAGTILRAGGVPTRLVSGLVNWDGSFYYHAWVEVWDGRRWLGIDPTVSDRQLSASHVALAHGAIADAFRFPVLDKVSIQVELAEGPKR